MLCARVGSAAPRYPPICPCAVVVGGELAALRSIGIGSIGVLHSVLAAVSSLHGVTFPGAPLGVVVPGGF